MKKMILMFFMLAVLVFSGCSRESPQEKLIGGDKDEHGCLIAAGYQWCPSTNKCQRMWEEYCKEYAEQYRGNEGASSGDAQQASHQDSASGSEQPEGDICMMECNPDTAWCQDDTFYACVEQDGCLRIAEVEPCGGDYSCETMMWCTSSTSNIKKGIIPLEQLTAMTPVKGNIGEEFSLNTDTYSGLLCSISKVIKGQAIFECS